MTTPPPTEAKKMNPALRIFVIICGLIVFAGGIVKMYKGWQEWHGAAGDAQFKPLLEENDKAIGEANKFSQEAQPMFQSLLDEVDKVGLAQVRARESATAQQIDNLFGKAADEFRHAVKTSEQAAQHHSDARMKEFLTAKGKSYTLFAQARDANREIIHVILDKSVVKIDDLLPKIQAIANQRDAAQKNAMELDAQAEAMAKKSK